MLLMLLLHEDENHWESKGEGSRRRLRGEERWWREEERWRREEGLTFWHMHQAIL